MFIMWALRHVLTIYPVYVLSYEFISDMNSFQKEITG